MMVQKESEALFDEKDSGDSDAGNADYLKREDGGKNNAWSFGNQFKRQEDNLRHYDETTASDPEGNGEFHRKEWTM